MNTEIFYFLTIFSFSEFISDAQFVIKIFVFLALVNYIRNHLGTGPIGIVAIVGLFVFIFFNIWAIFGTLYVLYMLFAFGFASIIIDFFFVGGVSRPPEPPIETPEGIVSTPVSHGGDVMKRIQHAKISQMFRKPPIMR